MKLDWVTALAVDDGPIDAQHQELFRLYNLYSTMPEAELDKAAILAKLAAYAGTHFQDEEDYMQAIGYPVQRRLAHAELHRAFVAKLQTLQDAPLYQVLDYFQEWLLRHIISEDRQIKVFLEPPRTR